MRAWRRIAVHACVGLIALAGCRAHAADAVLLVLSGRGGPYAEAADALLSEMNGEVAVTQRLAGEISAPLSAAPRAVVALGSDACRAISTGAVAAPWRLCALVPASVVERIAETSRPGVRPLSAIVLDQPPARQLALIRLAMPERRRLAVLYGPDSKALAPRLQGTAQTSGFRLQTLGIGGADDLADGLRQVLHEAEVLLALPDGAVFSSQTIQNVLITTFRNRVPVVAFSPAYVRAGALMAIYSAPEQVGRQAGRALRAALAGRELPWLQPPQDFVVRVNPDVARALGIELESEQSLAARLRRLESER
jgi:putative ABC transport system substrate-binding protein